MRESFRFCQIVLVFLIVPLGLIGCNSGDNFAPITTAAITRLNRPKLHQVRTGETLYAIAWRYDMDYRDVARANGIVPPYTLRVGQKITLKLLSRSKILSKKRRPSRQTSSSASNVVATPAKNWQWPVSRRRIIARYAPWRGKKGIDFAGPLNLPIRSIAAGVVAYSGHGLPGYGNLIIIKHNNDYLSAYAHNRINLVREGQRIKQGQMIARMGKTGSKRVKLHFELRYRGKPVNPLKFLS